MEGLIIAIDLAAVIAKMTSKTPTYNRVLEAERKKVALRAAETAEDAADAIELRRAEREARAHIYQAALDAVVEVAFDVLDAWKQVARWRIAAWVDEQTGEWPSGASGADSGGRPNARPGKQHGYGGPAGIPINSYSLGGLVDVSQPHERTPVTIPKPLARLAWLGFILQAALGGALLLSHAAHAAVAGGWLVLVTLAAAVALAIYSHGFRRGPSWAHLAAFGTGLLGLALPVVIILVNI